MLKQAPCLLLLVLALLGPSRAQVDSYLTGAEYGKYQEDDKPHTEISTKDKASPAAPIVVPVPKDPKTDAAPKQTNTLNPPTKPQRPPTAPAAQNVTQAVKPPKRTSSVESSMLVSLVAKLNVPILTKTVVFYMSLPGCASSHFEALQALYTQAMADPDRCFLHVFKELVSNVNVSVVDAKHIYDGVQNLTQTKTNQLLQLSLMMHDEEKSFKDMMTHLDRAITEISELMGSPKCFTDEFKDLQKKFRQELDGIASCIDEEVEKAVQNGKKGLHL